MKKSVLVSLIMVCLLLLAGCQETQAKIESDNSAKMTAVENNTQETRQPEPVKKAVSNPENADLTKIPSVKSPPEKIPPKPDTQSNQSQTQAKPEPKLLPKIVVTKAVHDFGKVGPSTRHNGTFEFKNEGPGELIVKRVQSTCGCSVPELKKLNYAPGESGEIIVRFSAASTKGAVTKRLYIESNDPTNPRALLEVKCEVIVLVKVEPEKLELFYNKPNMGIGPITVKSLDNKPFSITNIVPVNQGIKIDFDPKEKSEVFFLKPVIDPELISKRPSGVIQIYVDHPQAKRLYVQYRTKERYAVTRPRIIIQNAVPGDTQIKDVIIRSNYDEPVVIQSSESLHGNMSIIQQEATENAVSLKIKIQVPEIVDPKKRFFNDKLTITLEDGKIIEINSSGWYRRK